MEQGQMINGAYEVLEPIGEGGAGEVFLAWHTHLQKNVVIKKIKDHYVGRINERGEADILKKLHHRYLPQVYDFIQMDNEVYTVIDYVDGNTMADYIAQGVRFDEPQMITWTRQLLEALDYLHTQSPPIIHSDIKPSNIMIDKDGNICLIDFNISFDEEEVKRVSGYSAGYASPEQMRRAQMFTTGGSYLDIHIDGRSDIFSLGASLYHFMTMHNPVVMMNNKEPLWGDPLPYSDGYCSIIEKALRRNPDKRYPTAEAMLSDLNSIKQRDRDYARLKAIQTVFYVVAFVLLAAGGLMIYRGSGERLGEEFDVAYQQVLDGTGREDHEQTIDEAIALLNDSRYEGVLIRNPEKKADLFYVIANSYFENDDYQNAVSFYEKTVETDDSNPDYYRDYAIALARQGDIDRAEQTAEVAVSQGLGDEGLYLAKGEIDYAKSDYSNAADEFRKVIDMTGNDDMRGRAYLLLAQSYDRQGDIADAVRLLEEGRSKTDELWRLRLTRQLGTECVRYIEGDGVEASREYKDTAVECYTALIDSGKETFRDYMNLAALYEMTGDLGQASDVVNKAAEKYPGDYRIPMMLAVTEIERQSGLDESKRDYSGALDYYEKAEALYEKPRNAGKTDDEMQRLEGLIEQLYEMGWLER